MFESAVETHIEIDADARIVWEVLTGLDRYHVWNPMIRHASGPVEKGERLTLHFNPPGAKLRVFKPKLLIVEPEKELRWLGNPGVPWLFESEHYFLLEKVAAHRTLLKHNMLFYGILVPVFRVLLENKTKGPFELMNEACKRHAEYLSTQSAHQGA